MLHSAAECRQKCRFEGVDSFGGGAASVGDGVTIDHGALFTVVAGACSLGSPRASGCCQCTSAWDLTGHELGSPLASAPAAAHSTGETYSVPSLISCWTRSSLKPAGTTALAVSRRETRSWMSEGNTVSAPRSRIPVSGTNWTPRDWATSRASRRNIGLLTLANGLS